jgi:hypothetical protein
LIGPWGTLAIVPVLYRWLLVASVSGLALLAAAAGGGHGHMGE